MFVYEALCPRYDDTFCAVMSDSANKEYGFLALMKEGLFYTIHSHPPQSFLEDPQPRF